MFNKRVLGYFRFEESSIYLLSWNWLKNVDSERSAEVEECVTNDDFTVYLQAYFRLFFVFVFIDWDTVTNQM